VFNGPVKTTLLNSMNPDDLNNVLKTTEDATFTSAVQLDEIACEKDLKLTNVRIFEKFSNIYTKIITSSVEFTLVGRWT
jgi:hypothetical protein